MARRPLCHDVIPLQRLTSPHGGCLCCPLDSGFRRNDEGGDRNDDGEAGMTKRTQEERRRCRNNEGEVEMMKGKRD